MESSDVKVILEEMEEEGLDIQYASHLLDYMVPKKKFTVFLQYEKHQGSKEYFTYEEFISKHQHLGFSLVTIDRLKFIVRIDDMEKSIQHIFKVPHTQSIRNRWIEQFEKTISEFPFQYEGYQEIAPIYIKINLDDHDVTHRTFQFLTSLVPREESYSVSISYKMTPEWQDTLQKMVSVFKIVKSYETI
jgi:hypothetical protein